MEEVDQNREEYQLGWMVKKAPHHIEQTLDRVIPSDELQCISKSISNLSNFMNYCNLFEIYDKNLQSILSFHKSLPDKYKQIDRGFAGEFMEMSIQEMNRLFLNYLSSFRTVIDHLNTRYSHLEHQGTSFFEDFKKITSSCYDTNFYYRFFYKLRNYVQHCGLPISYMNASEQPVNGLLTVTISMGFNREALLDNYDGWGTVKNDLQKQPERFDFFPCLQIFTRETDNINLVATSIELLVANESLSELNKIFDEVKKHCTDGLPFIGRLDNRNSKPEIKMINFPFHQIQKYYEKYKNVQVELEQRKNKTTT